MLADHDELGSVSWIGDRRQRADQAGTYTSTEGPRSQHMLST